MKKKLIEEVVDQMNAVSARREEAEKAAEEAKKRAAKENAERAKAEAEAKKKAAKAAKPADVQGTADRNIEKNRTEN